MKRRKKILLFLLVFACLALFTGWAVKTVELLNENPPLIDLNAAIQEAKFGKNGNEAHQDGDDPNKPAETVGKEIIITIKGEGVWLGEHRYFSLDSLNTRLISNYQTGDTILLKDDYAEAHFYKEILSMLEKLNSERGFVYHAD
ncbi:MAG: hypothetical protein IKO41_19855 [Lachnospiraceae bacterium]|jgi:hypothetical protein|nr:hypothetical protein [Lachnospiraceae bacterium]